MATQTWGTPTAWGDALTTGLDSLANSAITAAGPAVSNEAGGEGYTHIQFELILASLTPTAGACLLVHTVKEDSAGSGSEDVSTSNVFAAVWTFTPSTSASAKKLVSPYIPHVWGDAKYALENRSGVALAASGNTLKYRRVNLTVA